MGIGQLADFVESGMKKRWKELVSIMKRFRPRARF